MGPGSVGSRDVERGQRAAKFAHPHASEYRAALIDDEIDHRALVLAGLKFWRITRLMRLQPVQSGSVVDVMCPQQSAPVRSVGFHDPAAVVRPSVLHLDGGRPPRTLAGSFVQQEWRRIVADSGTRRRTTAGRPRMDRR